MRTLVKRPWVMTSERTIDSIGIDGFSFLIQGNQQKSIFSKSEIVHSLRPIPLRICCVSPPSHHRAEYSWLLCSSITTNFISLRDKLVFNQSRFVGVIYSVPLTCSIISCAQCHSFSLNWLTCHLLLMRHSECYKENETNWMGLPEWRIEENVCLRQCWGKRNVILQRKR